MEEKCFMCGGKLKTKMVNNYPYTISGLSNVQIDCVVQHNCLSCDEVYTELQQVDKIHEEIGTNICHKQERLAGEELRFLRKELRFKGVDFARILSVSPEHLSRLENGQKEISEITDKFVRMLYLLHQSGQTKKVVYKNMVRAFEKVRPKPPKKKRIIKILATPAIEPQTVPTSSLSTMTS